MIRLLDASIGETIIAFVFGLLGLGFVIFFIVYLKAFMSKIFNTRYVDRQGRTKIDIDTFDNINELIGDKVSSLTTTIKKNYSQSISADETSNIIKPKIGIGGFYLDDPISKPINQLGENYEVIEHNSYSIEYRFPIYGISFHIKFTDIKKRIFLIAVFHPCKAKTSKGICIGSRLNDVIRSYGKPEYLTTEPSDIWSANFKGISFNFMRTKVYPSTHLLKCLT